MLNRSIPKSKVSRLGFFLPSTHLDPSQYTQPVAKTCFSSRVRLENSTQAKVPRVLKEIWNTDVVSAAAKASEHARASLCNILDYPSEFKS
jgi:hypothetical protein